MLAINRVAGPAVEPVTLDELNLFLRLNGALDGTTAEDPLLAAFLVSARQTVEGLLNRTLIDTTWSVTLDGFPGGLGYFNRAARSSGVPMLFLSNYSGEVELPNPPFRSLIGVEYLDAAGHAQVLDPTSYRVVAGTDSPTRLLMRDLRPWPVTYSVPGSVSITYVAGYGPDGSAVPEGIKTAIKMLAGHWYNNREPVAVGVATAPIPLTVDALLAPHQWGAMS